MATRLRRAASHPKHRVVRRVLRTDPSQEYFVYVPSTGGHQAPLLVAVHGIARNAKEQAKLFASYCETWGVVLVAPCFTKERYAHYQQLGRGATRADLTLDAIVEEVAWLTGAATTQIYLFGYSGGAQFAHRYLMAYPHRVARAVVAAAGWYTFPDPQLRFPYGIRAHRELPKVRFDPEDFLHVPIAVFVGERDVTDAGLRRSRRLDRQQGTTRVERARNWVAAMRETADAYHLETRVTFLLFERASHSFEDLMKGNELGPRVFESLFGTPTAVQVEGNGHGGR